MKYTRTINGIEAHRYAASFNIAARITGKNVTRRDLYKWLESIGVTNIDDLYEIADIWDEGERKLEFSAEKFIKSL